MGIAEKTVGLSKKDVFFKRVIDILISAIGLLMLWWIIVIAYIVATLDTGKNGLFTQIRVGRNGEKFRIIKIRTMRLDASITTTVTTESDPRITTVGRFFRNAKIDELPQLVNVLVGHMSLVGPRADVPGFADKLMGEERIVLSIKPGITGPATLKYRNEEALLRAHNDPEAFNRDRIFPDKVRINLDYVKNYSFSNDMRYIWETIFGVKNE